MMLFMSIFNNFCNSDVFIFMMSGFSVIFSILVIICQIPVFSLVFLIVLLIIFSCFIFFLEHEFLAFLFVSIYMGAIIVLFLFAIMMLETKFSSLDSAKTKYFPFGIILNFLILIFIINKMDNDFFFYLFQRAFYANKCQNLYDLIDSVADVEVYGQTLYSSFVLPFLLAGLILLLAVIGIVFLINTSYNKQILSYDVIKQLHWNLKIRL